MSLDLVRDRLVQLLRSVPEVGQVHRYQRYSRENSDFEALYTWQAEGGLAHVRGWYVRRTATEERTLGLGRVLNRHSWDIRGFMSLADEYESELVMDALVEALRAAYRADPTLGGACTAEMFGDGPDGMQLAESQPVLFCGVLCHTALLQLQTWSYT